MTLDHRVSVVDFEQVFSYCKNMLNLLKLEKKPIRLGSHLPKKLVSFASMKALSKWWIIFFCFMLNILFFLEIFKFLSWLLLPYKETVARRCSFEKVFLRISQKSQPATLIKKRLRHRCFRVTFAKFLRTPFLTEHLRWLLLHIEKQLHKEPKSNSKIYGLTNCNNHNTHNVNNHNTHIV